MSLMTEAFGGVTEVFEICKPFYKKKQFTSGTVVNIQVAIKQHWLVGVAI